MELWVMTTSMKRSGDKDQFIFEILSMGNLSVGALRSASLIVVNICQLRYGRALFVSLESDRFHLGDCLVPTRLNLIYRFS